MSVIDLLCVVEDGSAPPANQDPFVASEQAITITQGADELLRLTVRKTNGSLYDLTGATVRFAALPEPVDLSQNKPPTLRIDGITQGAPANGRSDITIPALSTVAISSAKPYRYDVFIIDGSAKRWRIVKLSQLILSGAANNP